MSAVSPPVYLSCGLRLRSEIEVGLPLADGPDFDVDVRRGSDSVDSTAIPPGELIAEYKSGDTAWYVATQTESGYILRFREVGDFVISTDLSEVTVHGDPSGRVDLLPILLAGTASAFLLTMRGQTVLHASAVAIGGNAIAFIGQSGRGKSTVAALLCVDGADLITDDVLAVDPGPPATCVGGAAELRLRAAAATIVRDRPEHRTRVTADERLAFAPSAAGLQSHQLAAIVIPSPSRTLTEVVVRRLAPSDAVFGLLAFPRVHGWRDPQVLDRDFKNLSQIANLVPVFEVTIPWGPPFSPEVSRVLSGLAVDPPVADSVT